MRSRVSRLLMLQRRARAGEACNQSIRVSRSSTSISQAAACRMAVRCASDALRNVVLSSFSALR
jgi:hypothetical protein